MFFDGSYRPVPLGQSFIGVQDPNQLRERSLMTEVCYRKACKALRNRKQVMVFVHSRKETVRTCLDLIERFQEHGELDELLMPDEVVFTKQVNCKTATHFFFFFFLTLIC